MRASSPDSMERLFAKSVPRGSADPAETLTQHTRSVLEQLAQQARLRPNLALQLGREDIWQLLFWSCLLHDFGKAMPGFQQAIRGKKAGWSGQRHEVYSLVFLEWIAAGLSAEQAAWIAAAILSHHKDGDELFTTYPLDKDFLDETSAMLGDQISPLEDATLQGIYDWLQQTAPEWIERLGFSAHAVTPLALCPPQAALQATGCKGAGAIIKRLRAYQKQITVLEEKDAWPARRLGILLRGMLNHTDYTASAHAAQIPPLQLTPAAILHHLEGINLFPHQSQAGESGDSTILIAPTGSGKTEAALLWAARVSQEQGLPRLFYTLPFQVSMNAMYRRLEKTTPGQVGLIHGRSLLSLLHRYEEEIPDPAEALRRARLESDLARLHQQPLRIFSPYSMLKTAFRIKGYEALLADFQGAAFIFDEIHAYETTRLAMILRTIAFLRQHFSAKFLVMSATMPTLLKTWLFEALGSDRQILASAQVFTQFQRHRLEVIEGDLLEEEGLGLICQEVRSGKQVLVICNTVARAQKAYVALRERLAAADIPVFLLHGQFTPRDRAQKEDLIQRLAAGHSEERQALVVVATQVVEVSLDIDLDTLFSDPAPLEALLQRFGRINRRRLQAKLAPVRVFTLPVEDKRPYDIVLLQRTLQALRHQNGQPIPEAELSTWLDEIYSGEVAERWQQMYQKAAREFEVCYLQDVMPFQASASGEEEFYALFDGIDVLPQSLWDEYIMLVDESPLRASELLLSISWRKYCMLKNNGLILPGEARNRKDKSLPPVVRGSYNAEIGLTTQATPINLED